MKTLITLMLLLATIVAQAQKSVRFYGQTLKAREVVGDDKFGPNQVGRFKTAVFDPPVTTTDLNLLLGQIYTNENNGYANTDNLLNIVNISPSSVSKEILYRFYEDYAFPHYLKDSLKRGPVYDSIDSLKDAFTNAKSIQDKANILKKHPLLNEALFSMIYDKYREPVSINSTYFKERVFDLGIGAKVIQDLKKIIRIDANLEAKIKKTLKDSVRLNNGFYHEVKLNNSFIAAAAGVFEKYNATRDILKNDNNEFNTNLLYYLKGEDLAVIVGYCAFELNFENSFYRDVESALGGVLKANLDIKDKPKAPQIAADIAAKFTSKVKGGTNVKMPKTFFIFKYIYSKRLEIGVGAE